MRASRSVVRLTCCLLAYTLLASLLAPPSWESVAASRFTAQGKGRGDAPSRGGELLVRFGAEVTERGRNDLAASRGARRKGRLRGDSAVERLEPGPGQDPAAEAERLRRQPGVEFAEPNFLVGHDQAASQAASNDTRFAEQWALSNSGQNGGAPGSDVRAGAAWQQSVGSYSTIVAVVDSGIDFTHPDLSAARWINPGEKADNNRDDDRDGYADDVSGWDWVANSGVVRDEAGHGTAVAGIIAAEGNNGRGVSGVMWRASLMSLRVLDSAGVGDVGSAVGVADAAGALAALRGNPYAGNGGGNGNGNGNGNGQGNGNGNGQGNGRPYVPPALRDDNGHGRGKDKKGLVVTPPVAGSGAPGAHLPDLNASRKVRTSPAPRAFSAPIQANMICADCDPSGGGGGGGSYPNDPYFGTARTRPSNDVGDPGVNLGSGNLNWSLPLLTLPGRADFNLSLALYYNSLVWIKQGTAIQYNADHGTPAPGFQLGLPRLQSQYFDSDANAYSYIMIKASGGRVEMRQIGSSGVYESADSTYTQLTFSGGTPVVRTTDGTQYVFGTAVAGGAEWRCTQIKDRNGNYISAEYATNGHLNKITDTLGREVNFVYNNDGNLEQITQAWGSTTHVYAYFTYGSQPLSLNFPNLSVSGVSGSSQTVLTSVVVAGTLDFYHFSYTSYGQVYKITHKAPDAHELAHTRVNLSDADLGTGAQTDCPRFSARYDYAQDWNNGAEAVTTYSVTDNATWDNPETQAQETGTRSQETLPDGTIVNVYSHSSGWDAGLTRLEEMLVTENNVQVRKKWTSFSWTQDNTSLSYQQNARMTETNVYDGTNRRQPTFEYGQGYGLPTTVREFGKVNGQMVLQRRTVTDYNLDTAYLNSRVIGLPWLRRVYDGASGLVSKVAYYYDWDGGGDMFVDTPAAATQHDRTNYGPSYLAGRGNLSDVIRFDVGDPDNLNGTIQETKYRVNSTGSVVMVRDHGWHATYFSYADSFSDNQNRTPSPIRPPSQTRRTTPRPRSTGTTSGP